MEDESNNLVLGKQRISNILVNGSFAIVAIAIFVSVPLYTVFVEAQGSESTEVGSSTANRSLVEFDSDIEQIRGHLEQAKANKEIGNTTLAEAHTLHPIDEIYSSIEFQIGVIDPGLNQSLASSLNQLSNMVDNSTVEEFTTELSSINGLLNNTVAKVIPAQEISDIGFNLAVAGNLLSVADNEYKEAIENGRLKEIVEYQDAQAFISRASSIFNESSHLIPPEKSTEVLAIDGFFADLVNAVQEKSNPEAVSHTIGSIVHEFSEVTGMNEENISGSSSGSLAYISEIRNLLNQTLDAYKNLNYNEADTLAIQAYLDNYEFIEAPLAEQNRTLMETTELILREDLRQLIQTHAPLEKIQEMIEKINSNLNQVEELLVVSG